jgi:hypothetical protein
VSVTEWTPAALAAKVAVADSYCTLQGLVLAFPRLGTGSRPIHWAYNLGNYLAIYFQATAACNPTACMPAGMAFSPYRLCKLALTAHCCGCTQPIFQSQSRHPKMGTPLQVYLSTPWEVCPFLPFPQYGTIITGQDSQARWHLRLKFREAGV